jgi:two-component system cell cycle response regulator
VDRAGQPGLPDTPAPAAVEIAERLRAAIEAMPLAAPVGAARRVTASFGVAFSRSGADEFGRMVATADHALYEAKQSGRNRVCTAPVVAGSVRARTPGT